MPDPAAINIRQYNDSLGVDGSSDFFTANLEKMMHVNSREAMVDKWTRDGRVFITNNGTIGTPETMSAAGTAITLTAPSLRYTIPAGSIVVPIHVAASNLRVITKDDLFAVVVTGSDSYSSGGSASRVMTAKNAIVAPNSAALRSSGVTNLHHSDTAIVEGALVNPRLLKRIKHEGVAGEVDAPWEPQYNILNGDPMVYLIGPASFLVFIIQETTAAEAEWSMSWAELATGVVRSAA